MKIRGEAGPSRPKDSRMVPFSREKRQYSDPAMEIFFLFPEKGGTTVSEKPVLP
jgi:hypothetical protein